MDHIHVKDTTIILAVHGALEISRYARCRETLERFGSVKHEVGPFPYTKYAPMDPNDRCYDNAMETVDKYGLKYIEGVMVFNTEHGPFPLSHGWCEDKAGNVIDPTCHKWQGVVKAVYCGVPIRPEYSREWKKRAGYYGCLDGHPDGRPWGPCHENPALWLDK